MAGSVTASPTGGLPAETSSSSRWHDAWHLAGATCCVQFATMTVLAASARRGLDCARSSLFQPLSLGVSLRTRVWNLCVGAVIIGTAMVAFGLAVPGLRWVGWLGLTVIVAGAVWLARGAYTPLAPPTKRPPSPRPFPPHRPMAPAEPVTDQATTTPPAAGGSQQTPAAASTVVSDRPSSGVPPASSASHGPEMTASSEGEVAAARASSSEVTSRDPGAPAPVEPEPAVVEVLAAVPGLGPSKQQALAVAFPTMGQLGAASIAELTAVDGVGPKVAQRLRTTLELNIDSLLADISGVGPGKRQALKTRFDTAGGLLSAPAERISEVDGISPAMAARIRGHLDERAAVL